MILGITGHTNIEKCQGIEVNGIINKYDRDSYFKTKDEIEKMVWYVVKDYGYPMEHITFISGMARGVDEIFADIAMELGRPLILAIPGSLKWHQNRDIINGELQPKNGVRAQAVKYNKIVEYAKQNGEIVEIGKNYGTGHNFVNFARNQYMVDRADLYLSYKKYKSTGTDDTIKRAKKATKYIGNIITIDDELGYNVL